MIWVLLIGCALGFGLAYQLRITAHDVAQDKHAKEKGELNAEIKRMREQVSRIIGTTPATPSVDVTVGHSACQPARADCMQKAT